MRLFCLLLFPIFVIASEKTWVINKDHSEIVFEVPYLGVTNVSGKFSNLSGNIQFDGESPVKANLQISVNSINTGNKMRDKHLRSSDFLYLLKFPNISFESSSVVKKGNKFEVTGLLKIKKVSKTITFLISSSSLITDPWGHNSRFLNFSTMIKRSDFGLEWNKSTINGGMLVGDKVTISGKLQIQPVSHKTPTSKHMIPDTEQLRKRANGEVPERIKLVSPKPRTQDLVEIKKEVSTVSVKKGNFDKTLTWWVSYFLVGFMGFLSMLGLIFYGKNLFVSFFPNFEETNTIGYISDIVVYPIGFLYILAMWYLGFGG